MKRIYTILSIIVSISFFIAIAACEKAPDDTIKIGVAGAHSGDLASYGLPTVKAVEMVVNDLNTSGGINGKRIELLIEDDVATDVYMAVSRDGGQSFQNFCISSSPFVPQSNIFFGDYTNVSAHDNVVRPIWTRLHNANLSVWTAIIDVNYLGVDTEQDPIPMLTAEVYPNPSVGTVYFSFKVHRDLTATLDVVSAEGKVVTSLFREQEFGSGKYIESFEPSELGLAQGFISLN